MPAAGGGGVPDPSDAAYDWLSHATSYGFIEWPFDFCEDGRLPLAGQELLAIVVLLHWLKLGRIASQSSTLGPLFQCCITMLSDMGKFTALSLWILVAFTSCFTVLFLEPYGENSQGDCDPDFDVAFESWTGTFSLLIELMLTAGVEL